MGAVALCQLAGVAGALLSVQAIPNWYNGLVKPAFNPPSWVFGPAWTVFYLLMGIALFFVWEKGVGRKISKTVYTIFGIQLFLNAIWSIIFFGFQNPFWALIDLVSMWLVIAGTIILFYRISKPAAYLLVPYILWVSFAGYLNYSIWQLNRSEQVFCTQEAKICSDGSGVGRTGPKCEFTACPKEDLIVVDSPRAYEKISSPLVVMGRARGTWYFEASFPVKLFDDNGKELVAVPAQAKTNWMTTDLVEFSVVLNFSNPATQKGYIILEKDNPSGLPENADELKIPVSF